MRTRARADRWSEEVTLVVEEMRRVLCFLKWKSEWWKARTTSRDVPDIILQEGLVAYSTKQAQILEALGGRFAAQWLSEFRGYNIEVEGWPSQFVPH
jgi:hypothetical protein